MKNQVLGAFLSLFVLFIAPQINAQTTLQVDNASGCTYEILIILSDNATPCTALPSINDINGNVPTTGASFTIPAGRTICRVRLIGCCAESDGNTTVSFNCSPSSVTGNTECFGDPVTVNMVSNTLIEISI